MDDGNWTDLGPCWCCGSPYGYPYYSYYSSYYPYYPYGGGGSGGIIPCDACGGGGTFNPTMITITSATGALAKWFSDSGIALPHTFAGNSFTLLGAFCLVNGSFSISAVCDICSNAVCVFYSTTNMTFADCTTTVVAESLASYGCHQGGISCDDPANIPDGGVSLSNLVCDMGGFVSVDFSINSSQGIIQGTVSI